MMKRWLKIAAVLAVALDFLTPGFGLIGGAIDPSISVAKAAGIPANTYQNTPPNATAQTSTTGVMAGIGQTNSFTPHYDGVALVTISGNEVFGATGATAILGIRYGTGTAPANNAASTGSACGNQLANVSLTGVLTQNFSVQCVVTGLVLNTGYWFDLVMGSSTSTINVTNVSVSVAEQ
jgi:hypothetical protein